MPAASVQGKTQGLLKQNTQLTSTAAAKTETKHLCMCDDEDPEHP